MQLIEAKEAKYIEAANHLIKIDADGNEWILIFNNGYVTWNRLSQGSQATCQNPD